MENKQRSQKSKGESSGTPLLLPFADAPSIVQAHQKDDQIESILSNKVEEVIKKLKGQLFVNKHPREIAIAVKLLYLSITTLIGNRTLGEEYVDLVYVNRKGNRLVQRYRKLLFILSYTLGPYFATKVWKRWKKVKQDFEDESETTISWQNISNALLNAHMIIFYFKGAYYNISKRIFGLRYALGHKVEDEESKFRKSSSNSYKMLGYFLLAQGMLKSLPIIIEHIKKSLGQSDQSSKNARNKESSDAQKLDKEIENAPKNSEIIHINLADPSQLPFIPSTSRTCILCLNEMMDPSCSPCGHIFCWACILNWCKEREECPLCRQKCLRQQILPLR